ncbi:hypothetical protein ACSZOJ_00430 [Aeromonas dhakensis]
MKDKKNIIAARIFGCRDQVSKVLSRFIKSIWGPLVALLSVALIWFNVASDIPLPTEQTVEKYGVYGDSFGRITSLFTALGFGGLIITLLLQQRQIRAQEADTKKNRQNDERGRYEEVLFRLLDIYRQTLSEVRVGDIIGRSVLKDSLDRVDTAIVEEGVNGLPRDIKGRWDRGSITRSDRQRIDYLQFRNFKIVATEIHPQARLVDTFEVLLDHMLRGAPDHLLIDTYRELVLAQITYLECRYFFWWHYLTQAGYGLGIYWLKLDFLAEFLVLISIKFTATCTKNIGGRCWNNANCQRAFRCQPAASSVRYRHIKLQVVYLRAPILP